MGLGPLASWVCGIEYCRGHGCPSLVRVVCLQVEVCAAARSLVQRSPTECVSLSVFMCNNLYIYNELVEEIILRTTNGSRKKERCFMMCTRHQILLIIRSMRIRVTRLVIRMRHRKYKQNFDRKTIGGEMFLCGFFKDLNFRACIASNVNVEC